MNAVRCRALGMDDENGRQANADAPYKAGERLGYGIHPAAANVRSTV